MSDAAPPAADAAPAAPPPLSPPARVLVAKPGLDGHDRGAKVVARALRDAGMEVIYTGIRQTPPAIAEAALQEDAEAVGLSILSGAHLTLVPRVLEELRAREMGDVVLWVGGIIPAADVPALRALGVAAVFGPGSPMDETVRFVREAVAARRARAEPASAPDGP
ncbi:MAG TPA: cobalamin B12-binding domain-containing protein [Chloroflexota bacterium]|nr:cobalamin B12-binding domain-containing protein [Chloroflexota bacterium]